MGEEGKESKASGDSRLNFVAGLVWFEEARGDSAVYAYGYVRYVGIVCMYGNQR